MRVVNQDYCEKSSEEKSVRKRRIVDKLVSEPLGVVWEELDRPQPISAGFEQSFHVINQENSLEHGPVLTELGVNISNLIWDAVISDNIIEVKKNQENETKQLFLLVSGMQTQPLQLEAHTPFKFYDFKEMYRATNLVFKILHECAVDSNLIITPAAISEIKKEPGYSLVTDNHISVGMHNEKIISNSSQESENLIRMFNNIRKWLPEIAAPASNSPFSCMSLRNVLHEISAKLPFTCFNINSYNEFFDLCNLQKINPKFYRNFAVKNTFFQQFEKQIFQEISDQTNNVLDFNVYDTIIAKYQKRFGDSRFERVDFNWTTKPFDVLLDPLYQRIEVISPDGMTCARDVMHNVSKVVLASQLPKYKTNLPKILEAKILAGQKMYSSLFGESFFEIPTERAGEAISKLPKSVANLLLSDPLALYRYLSADMDAFDTIQPSCLANETTMSQLGLPKQILHDLVDMNKRACASRTYIRQNEPGEAGFDNLAENKPWIKI